MDEGVYTASFSDDFATLYANLSEVDQYKIRQFIHIFKEHGLSDFELYEGKITPSYTNLDTSDPKYRFARDNHLWHYHIGIPEYKDFHGKYKTSSWVLHFQWFNRGNQINIVDLYDHYLGDEFYLPKLKSLIGLKEIK